ncbi:MAG: proprotein convertase P-domain-containing protein [Phycisphaerales bacterium]|jgi:subtilisin-like proprotein convertase family protein|nr:proprotein convertase P-domain-containing protein [Phycisphaerales bacterium]
MFKLSTIVSASAVLLASTCSFAQPSVGSGWPVDAVPSFEIPELDWAALFAEDASRSHLDEAPRYAIPHKVQVTPATHGLWEQIDARTMRWSLRVRSRNAVSINLGFEEWALPVSGSMIISSFDLSQVLRDFTSADNKEHGQLWTPAIAGDDLLIEIFVAPHEQQDIDKAIVLSSINVGYRGFYEQGVDRSGSCNYDVVCEEGDDWWNEIPCVAVISTGGSTFCTGFMVNNTSQDRTPYFMTANHCGVNSGSAPSLVTYWNYQNSYCRVPGSGDSGGSGDGQLNQFNTGSTHLSSGSFSDYTLVVMDDSPNDAWEVSYCGWDATGDESPQGIAIHHPSTDEKRISFEFEPTTTTSYLGESIPGDGSHVRIEDWDLGTTEPGSSGSPVFNSDHQVIGQLHGGYASCTSQTSDWYGKFSVSFDAGLDVYLDAAGTGSLTVNTLPGTGMSVNPGEAVLHICTSPCVDPDPSEVLYTMANNSPDTISYRVETVNNAGFILIDGGSSVNGFLASGNTVDILVSVDASGMADGVHDEVVRFMDQTNARNVDRLHTLDIGTTDFDTTPDVDFYAGGPVGGPFTTTQVYTITSTRPTMFDVHIGATADWITINGSNEAFITLNGTGDSADITIGFGGNVEDLPAGIVEGDVFFENYAAGSGDTTRHVTLDIGRYTYVATDLPLAINDNETTTSYITVNDAYCIGDVDIELDLTHTYIGDLEVDVTSPEGTTVRLHDRSGGGDDDLHMYYDEQGGDIPEGPGSLADWEGEIVTGTWRMDVTDNAGADTGTLDHWALKIASSGDICPPVAQDVEVFTDENVPIDITLIGASPDGGALEYIITSNPAEGALQNLDGSPIGGLPYTLEGDQVRYVPDTAFIGIDSFTYKVTDGIESEDALVSIHVGEIPFPDECETAQLVANGLWEFSTLEGTTSSDSYNDGQCQGTYLGVMTNDVWFRYEACATGPMTVSTCDLVDFDTDLVVYEGTCNSMTQIACNGDGDGCGGYSSILTGTVVEGTTYLIRVGGWGDSSMGSGELLVDGPTGDCNTPCEGDVDEDGEVAVSDILIAIDQWGSSGSADINGDGIVDVEDLLAIVGAWGACP